MMMTAMMMDGGATSIPAQDAELQYGWDLLFQGQVQDALAYCDSLQAASTTR
jgi:hypothetical protein